MDLGNEEKGTKLFSGVPSDCRRGYRHKLKHTKFHLNTRNYLFFPVEVVKHWNSFPREVVEYPYLKVLQT